MFSHVGSDHQFHMHEEILPEYLMGTLIITFFNIMVLNNSCQADQIV